MLHRQNPKKLDGYPFPVEIRYSSRKTCQLSVLDDESLLLRLPYYASEKDAVQMIEKHRSWIEKKLELKRQQQLVKREAVPFNEAEKAAMKRKARQLISVSVERYEALLGVSHTGISYRFQKTRWGSCSRKGGLNFNCLLVLCPPEVLDSVVAHELCHRKYMNHSAAFYRELFRVFPEYKKCRRWLKEHGSELMERLK